MIDKSKTFNNLKQLNTVEEKLNIGSYRKCLDSYFSMRQHLVRIDGLDFSSWLIFIGILQRCALKSVVFLIFYVKNSSKCSYFFNFFLYADDTRALATETTLNILIRNIDWRHWVNEGIWLVPFDQLSINFNKCIYLIVKITLKLSLVEMWCRVDVCLSCVCVSFIQ